MPELPEVETTCRGIKPHIEKQVINALTVRDKRLRWPVADDLAVLLDGKQIQAVSRRGKYILLTFAHGTLLMHLGMSGVLRIVAPDTPLKKHDHIDFVFDEHILRFNDPRRFGAMVFTREDPNNHPLLNKLGPEPLSPAFNADYLISQTRGRKTAIKTFIMNSHIVVGVGNIYANETLFLAGIHPHKAAGKVSKTKLAALVEAIKSVLQHAISQGGTTLKDFYGSDGKPGYFKQQLNVYGRSGLACTLCEKALTGSRLGNRTTVYCTHCQK